MIREQGVGNHTFVSAIEAHGDYNPGMEYTIDPYSSIQSMKLIVDSEAYTIVQIITRGDKTITICLSNANSDPNAKHSVSGYSWTGVCSIK